jgi:hypothetical protein
MDRRERILQMNQVYAEANAPQGAATGVAIAAAADDLAQFLDADQVVWGRVPEIWPLA